MVERRRRAAQRKRERSRREQVAIAREKAAARREKAPTRREEGAWARPAKTPRARRAKGASGRPSRKPAAGTRSRTTAGKRSRAPVRARGAAAAQRGRAAALARGKRARAATATGAKRARRQARPAARTAAARITGFGERASRVILAAFAPVGAAIVGLVLLARRGLAWLAAAVTPLRAAIAVTGIAAVLLAVSQFVDYRGVAVGVDDYGAYADVESVAPAPQVDRRETGEAHSYLLVPVAALALLLLAAAARGRWQLGRVISLLGVGALAVAILVDVPAGLDESEQAIAYTSVEAQLLEGFYVQVVSAAVLVAGGLLVSRYARPAKGRGRARTRRGAAVRRLGTRTA